MGVTREQFDCQDKRVSSLNLYTAIKHRFTAL